MATPKKPARYTVVCQEWLESEAGWGCRPDGASLHLTSEDKDAYIKDYWASMPAQTPHEYSRPDGTAKIIEVSRKTYTLVKKSGNGIRLWQNEYRELEAPPKPQPSKPKKTKTEARIAELQAKRAKLKIQMDKLLAELEALSQ